MAADLSVALPDAGGDDDGVAAVIAMEQSGSMVCIGDHISLKITTPNGEASIWGGGILDDHVELAVQPKVFDDCIFQVCGRNRLSASMQWQEFMEKRRQDDQNGVELSEEEEDRRQSFQQTLERVKQNEQKLNQELFKQDCGKPITFGQVIQLRHVKSGHWLNVSPEVTARTERHNLSVHLHAEGTQCSWFTVLPALTVDEEGMPVENMGSVMFSVTEVGGDQYLHSSAVPIKKAHGLGAISRGGLEAFEVNCSLDKASWRLSIFNKYESDESEHIYTGQLVSLSDGESNTTLRFLTEREKGQLAEDEEAGIADRPFFHPRDPHVTSIHTGSLWAVERVAHEFGGQLTFGEWYHLRNPNSGKYLGTGVSSAGLTYLTASDVPAAFQLAHMSRGQAKEITEKTPLHLSLGDDMWVSNGRWVESAGNMCMASVVKDKSLALVLQIETADAGLVLDSRLMLCAMPHLQRFLGVVREADFEGLVADFPKFEDVMQHMKTFVTCESATSATPHSKARKQRQRAMRDQGAVDFLIDALLAAYPLVKRSKTKKGAVQLGDEVVSVLHSFVELCFEMLQCIIHGDSSNQLYLADNFTVLVPFLDMSELAMRCMNEMLANNMEVQEKKITQSVLDQFIAMLRDSTMNYTILSVLRAICSCQGQGIDSNQTMLATLLLIQGQDLLIQTRENEVNANELKVLCPSEVNEISLESLHGRSEKYFVAQLYTFAEMCYDRNYIAMSILHEMLPYSVLIKISKSDGVASSMRAAAIRLISYLYVDCKPQEGFKFDNLTFAWSAIEKEVHLPEPANASENDTDNFSGLKSMISQELQRMNKGNWSRFTQQTMMVLQQLVSFKFYSSADELRGIVRSLVCALDPHQSGSSGTMEGDKGLAASMTFSPAAFKGQGSTMSSEAAGAGTDSGGTMESGAENEDHSGEESKQVRRPRVVRPKRSKTQQKVLDILESMKMLCGMLSLVFLSCAVSLEGTLRGADMEASNYFTFDLITCIIFSAEMITRMWALNSLSLFFHDPFCLVDFLVVSLDVLTLVAGGLLGSAGGFTKSLRAIRIARLARVLRAARIVSKIMYRATKQIVWEPPARFSSTPDMRMKTMVLTVQVLKDVSRLAHCFRLWTLVSELKQFHDLDNDIVKKNGGAATMLSDIFEKAMDAGAPLSLETISSGGSEVDEVLLDLCLHKDDDLVREALQLLIMYHSSSKMMLDDLRNVQLLVGPLELQYKDLEKKVSLLKYQVETQELWGSLETEEHRAASNMVKDILRDLTDRCREPSEKLKVCSTCVYEANEELQTMMRNLGLFEVCMMVMALTAELENEDDDAPDEEEGDEGAEGFAEEEQNTREILKLCSVLLCWFIHDNVENQKLAMAEFSTFADNMGADIGCTHVIVEIVRDNMNLVKLVPETFIRMACNQIVNKGKKAKFLDLLDVLTHIGEIGIRDNQIEVVKQLTSPDIAKYVLSLPSAAGTEENERFLDIMRKHTTQQETEKRTRALALLEEAGLEQSEQDQRIIAREARKAEEGEVAIPTDDIILQCGLIENPHLPPEIQYYTRFLSTLSGCAAGMINIVEAKVQSLVPFEVALEQLLHPDTILEVRIALSRFFYDVIVDVQIFVPGLSDSPAMWKYLETFPEWIAIASKAGSTVLKEGVANPVVALQRQQLCYVLDCLIPMLEFFFKNYYDDQNVPLSKEAHDLWAQRVFKRLCAFHGMTLPFLAAEQVELLTKCIITVHHSCGGDERVGRIPSTLSPDTIRRVNHKRRRSSHGGLAARKMFMAMNKRTSLMDSDATFLALRNSFGEYTQKICASEPAKEAGKSEVVKLIEYVKELPKVSEEGDWTDLRYEAVLEAWVEFIRNNIKHKGKGKTMSAADTKSATWMIRLMRSMIEYEWGFTIDERDDEGDEESDEVVKPVQDALNQSGATTLCLDLIAPGIDLRLMLEAVKLLVGLLYKEGGNVDVQTTINEHLRKDESSYFFAAAQEQLRNITRHFQDDTGEDDDGDDDAEAGDDGGDSDSDDDDDNDSKDVQPDEMVILVRMLQLSCEGHYFPNQEIMRVQPHSSVSINLLEDMAHHLEVMGQLPKSAARTEATMSFADAILEVIQGPCKGNQMYLTINCELVEVLNRMMRARENENDCEEEDEQELKACVLDIYKALLEGQTKPSVIFDRILSVIHVDALQMLVLPRPGDDEHNLSDLQVNALVLVQMLSDYDPHLKEDLTLPKDIVVKMSTQVLSIEVFWNGDLQRRFFPVPEMCQSIPSAAKDYLVEHVERSNPELKLLDFVQRSRDMYVELQHEVLLQKYHVDWVFNRKTQDQATWIAFGLACLVNILILGEQHENPNCPDSEKETLGGCITLSPGSDVNKYGWFSKMVYNIGGTTYDFTDALKVLNTLQIIFASFTFLLFLVVRVPVKYQLTRVNDGGRSVYTSVVAALTDPQTLYYGMYVIVCLLALEVSNLFASLLLLDIVMKNSTTRDVLRAVMLPAKQLAATLVLATFTIYIFSFFMFQYFKDDFGAGECNTLMRCFQTTVGYGLRQSGGIGDQPGMNGKSDGVSAALGPRFILDLVFFVMVLIVLMNIIFGIIIDTFSELREEKKIRLDHTVNTCFICGLEKLTFDRAAPNLEMGFRHHIREDHHMWSYLKFMIFLFLQDQDDDDGLELYVRQCLETDDLSWLPMEKALCLQAASENKESSSAEQLQGAAADLKGSADHTMEALEEIEEKMALLGKTQDKLALAIGGNKRASASTGRLRNSQLESLDETAGRVGAGTPK